MCHYVSELVGMYFSRAIRAITPYPHIVYWIPMSAKNILFVQCAYNTMSLPDFTFFWLVQHQFVEQCDTASAAVATLVWGRGRVHEAENCPNSSRLHLSTVASSSHTQVVEHFLLLRGGGGAQ